MMEIKKSMRKERICDKDLFKTKKFKTSKSLVRSSIQIKQT